MTGPFLSLAQIRNRLILTARTILRHHHTGPDGRCRACRTQGCPVATAARNVLRAAEDAPQRSTATPPAEPDRDGPEQAELPRKTPGPTASPTVHIEGKQSPDQRDLKDG